MPCINNDQYALRFAAHAGKADAVELEVKQGQGVKIRNLAMSPREIV